jgi:hypothetical protein
MDLLDAQGVRSARDIRHKLPNHPGFLGGFATLGEGGKRSETADKLPFA